MIEHDHFVAPLSRLLSSYAGCDAAWHKLVWAYDARLADVVRTTREPMVGQMRLAWWHEALSDDTGLKGKGDPLVDALRKSGRLVAARNHLLAMIDGWEVLLDPLPLEEAALRIFATGRGGGLFRALDAKVSPDAGALWALWDLSGHIDDATTVDRTLKLARNFLSAKSAGGKAVRLAMGLARHDITRGQRGPREMSPHLYMRLLRLAVFGR